MNFWTLQTFDSTKVPNWVYLNYEKVLPYISGFLTSKHPYRNGVMCPFMPKAIKEDLIFFTYFDGSLKDDGDRCIKNCLDQFKKSIGEKNGSIIIIFSDEIELEQLLDLHVRNKKRCINNWVMLGLLYRTNSAASLHSQTYYPLRTPTPLAVLRNLTSSDLVFLDPAHYSKLQRTFFLNAFVKRFSVKSSSFARTQVLAAKKLRMTYIIDFLVKTGFCVVALGLLFALTYGYW